MRPVLTCLICVLLSLKVASQPPLAWANQLDYKIINNGLDWISAVDVDKYGTMYVAGRFSDTLDIDPSQAFLFLNTDHYNGSGCILKFSSAGKLMWGKAITLSGLAGLYIKTIKADSLGYVYVAGSFWGTADFDPGPLTFSLNGASDGFVMKLDPIGNLMWVKQFKPQTGSNGIQDITFDAQLNLYLTGTFSGTADMDPGPKKFYLQNTSWTNVFVTRLDKNGDFNWAKGLYGTNAFVYDIKCDKYGNILFCGSAGPGTDLDPGPAILKPVGNCGYICTLDSNGVLKKALIFDGNCQIQAIVVSDEIGFLGQLNGNSDLDPGPLQYQVIPSNGNKGFFGKLDTLGNLLWTKEIAAVSSSTIQNIIFTSDIQTDSKKDLYVFTFFTGTYDFDPGVSTSVLSAGSSNYNVGMSFSAYDASGSFQWAHLLPNQDWPLTYSPSQVTPEGDVYSANGFIDTIDCDPGITAYNLISKKGGSIFLRKLSHCKNLPAISLNSDKSVICKGEEIWLTASGGESYTWNHYFSPVPVVITYPQNTITYHVIGKDNMGCKSSAEILVKVNECNSLEHINPNGILIYPNPAKDLLIINSPSPGQLKLSDAAGRLLREITLKGGESAIDVTDLTPGLYFVNFKCENNLMSRKKLIRE